MANPARDIRSAVQARHPGAAVVERGRNHIRHQIDVGRFALTSSLGPLHYGPAADQEIDTAWVDAPLSESPWLKAMTANDFNVFLGPGTLSFDAGHVIKWRHPESNKEISFQPLQLQWVNDLSQIEAISDPQAVTMVTDDGRAIAAGGYGTGLDFSWEIQTARLQKLLTIQSAADLGTPPQFIIDGGNPALRMQFAFDKSAGVEIWVGGQLWDERSNNPVTGAPVEFRLDTTGEVLWYFNYPHAWDAEGDEVAPTLHLRKVGQDLHVEIRVPWTWLEAATYPIYIDPTIDDQVGASGNDTTNFSGTDGFTSTVTNGRVGWTNVSSLARASSSYRFTGISGLAFATIDVAYIEIYVGNSGGNPLTRIAADDQESPAAPTSEAEFEAITETTANVDWDGALSTGQFHQSPSIVSVIQELADNYDPDVIQIMHMDDGSSTDGHNVNIIAHYDGSTTDAPKLHIEYTEGAAPGGVPWHLFFQQTI